MNLKENENYLSVSDMLLTVTMLSNKFDENLDEDASLVVDFIGRSFSLTDEDIKECYKLVIDDLSMISTTSDVEAFYKACNLEKLEDIKEYLSLKCDSINKMKDIALKFNGNNSIKSYFDYTYLREYYPNNRFKELEKTASYGNVDVYRVVAILLALGIGCKKDINGAIYRLKQCAYWGDINSLFYLSYLYRLDNDRENTKLFSDLASLKDLIQEGRTILPKELSERYDEETKSNFKLITLIRQEIVLSLRNDNINFPFLEVIFKDDIDYYKKIGCINNYQSSSWKEILNSSSNPYKKMGFNEM